MRSIVAFSFGILASAVVFLAIAGAPVALGGDDCPPGVAPAGGAKPAGGGAPAGAPAGNAPAGAEKATPPKKEASLASPLLTGLVGEWSCDCAYPTGGHAAGDATVKMVMDGTALMTESELDWKVGEDKSEKIHNIGIWKVGADGKSLSYWGFSSHDSTADLLKGTLTDDKASVTGMTRWGPMRLALSLKDGNLSQQLWIDHKDMGTVTFTKK